MADLSPAPQWLALIGIGEDGRAGLSLRAQKLMDQATLIVGGTRHLELARPLRGETMTWPTPLTDAIPMILARRPAKVCVIASGDPFFYGVGSLLAAMVPPAEMICMPAPSSFSLAAARLGWPLQSCRFVSLHGRALARIIPELQPRAKILALSWDESTPGQLVDLLCERGFGNSIVWVMEALGGARERIGSSTAHNYRFEPVDPLNLVALDVVADTKSRALPIGPGLADSWFESDGQLTKRHVRAVTLSALAPRRGELLWDVGAGAGSIAIEWLLLDPHNRAIAVEANRDRAARIARNAAALGVPQLEIVIGDAPKALERLPRPDAVFIGGSSDLPGAVEMAYGALEAGGRLVVNAVTIETQSELGRCFQALGGELVTIDIGHADRLGAYHAWKPARPIMQWVAVKDEPARRNGPD